MTELQGPDSARQRVESDIRRVEGEIQRVEQQITQASDKIEQLGGPGEETKPKVKYWVKWEEDLRREKEQLRREKEQLRREKEQLREQQKLLLERRGAAAGAVAGGQEQASPTSSELWRRLWENACKPLKLAQSFISGCEALLTERPPGHREPLLLKGASRRPHADWCLQACFGYAGGPLQHFRWRC